MQLIASYPVQADIINPYCGQTVLAQTVNGDMIVGILDRVEDGMAHFRMVAVPDAKVQHVRNQIRNNMKKTGKGKKTRRIVVLNGAEKTKAKTAAFGYPGYGYGGFGGYGYGAGLALALPLFLLTALFVSPFLWW